MSAAPTHGPGSEPGPDDGWILRYDCFDPASEGLREALCTLGNGLFATRGAAPEATADGIHYPGTYVAGLYNRRGTQVAGRTVENESVVNVPNWLPLRFRIEDGAWFSTDDVTILGYSQELDLRRGTLRRSLRVEDGIGHVTRIDERRLVSMSDPHAAGLDITLSPENWSGRLTVRSGIDGRISNAGVPRYAQFDEQHLVDVNGHRVDGETVALTARTSQSGICIAQTARTRMARDGARVEPPRQVIDEPGSIAEEISVDIGESGTITIEKIVTLFTSRDRSISDPLAEARSWSARCNDFPGLLDSHTRAWGDLWRRFSLEVEADGHETQLTLRLHIFHLLQTASRNTLDLDVGIPARGLSGEAYRGHIFWDELFIFPSLNLHLPEVVRALLHYRYRRLPEARWAAAGGGPWRSNVPLAERQQRAGGGTGGAPQPALGPLVARRVTPPTAHQCGHRLQRLAVRPGDGGRGLHGRLRGGDDPRDLPLLGQHRPVR